MHTKKQREQGIKKVSDLFAIYRERLIAPQKSVIQATIDVVSDLFGVTITESECNYTPSSRLLKLSVRGPLKSELFLHKKEILTHLKGRLGEKSAPKDMV